MFQPIGRWNTKILQRNGAIKYPQFPLRTTLDVRWKFSTSQTVMDFLCFTATE